MIFLLDDTYGLIDVKGFSPLITSIMAYLSFNMSYEEAQKTISEILTINISSTSMQNQSEKRGKEVFNDMFSYIPPGAQRKCDGMLLFSDGGMLHTGKDSYKDVRVGVIVKYYDH